MSFKYLTFFIIFGFIRHLLASEMCDTQKSTFAEKLNSLGQLFSDQYGSDVVNADQGAAASDILNIKKTCSKVFSEQNIDHCFKNIFEFSHEIQKVYAATNGTAVFDMAETYKKSNKKVIQLPKEFKNGLPRNWKEIAEKNNWKYLEYRSRTVANPPAYQYSRILFFVELDGIDQWIQFTVPDLERNAQPKLIDLISIEKADSKKGIEKNRINFTQYARNDKGENPVLSKHVDACYRCHASGMRQLNPAPGSFEKNRETVNFFNKKMQSYGETDWSNFVDVTKLGPYVGKSQGCTHCHNNYEDFEASPRGALHYLFSPAHIEHKMLAEVTMPRKVISKEDRIKLMSALEKMSSVSVEKMTTFLKESEQNRIGSYENTLSFLKKEGLLSHTEYEEASNIYSTAYHANKPKLDQIKSEYKVEVKKWFATDTLSCIADQAKKASEQSRVPSNTGKR